MSRRRPSLPAARPSGFFVLRTPLLPFTDVTRWGEDLEATSHLDDGTLGRALGRDRAVLRRRLEDVVTTPAFRDAVFVASPSLEAAIDGWRKDPDGHRGRAAEDALVAYFLRAAARPTPFGLFAGCTTGVIGDRTRLELDGRHRYRRSTRLDMDYLWALAAAVERDPSLRRGLVFRPNSGLSEVGDRLLFAEARENNGGRSYQLVAVDTTPYLLATLERARSGASLDDLAAALVDDEITRADAEGYLDELVDSQLLVGDVRPQLSGPPPTEAMVATLSRSPATAGIAERLADARRALAGIDEDGLGVPAQRYSAVAAALEDLPARPDVSRLVQVDLVKPPRELTLGEDVVRELLRGADLLHAFSSYQGDDALRRFREQFSARYETRELPLAQVLDEEHGIGFDQSAAPSSEAAPLLAGLPLGNPGEQAGRWTGRDGFLLQRLTACLSENSSEICLSADDVDAVRRDDAPPLPSAFEVLAEVSAPSEQALGDGDFRVVVHSASGPSGARLLGRFCHLDEPLHQLVRAHLRAEEASRPDRVFAEVVHLPEGRVGNILSRPVLRDHEIPYLGRSGAPQDSQLELADLLVTVQGERIVLRSRRLGREVVPRLTTAHQYRRGLGVYRFLCALQHQQVNPGVVWDWGPLGGAPFLPRVVSGRLVLSRARWMLGRADLDAFREPDTSRCFRAVQRLRDRLRLPRYVALADADNELLVDLDNVLSVEALSRQVRRRRTASLVELTPADHLRARGPEGFFTHQILVPFVQSASEPPPGHAAPRPGSGAPRRVRRRFPPGSEWLYLKLYSGPATSDQVLERLGPVVRAAVSQGAADRWFFIRYQDSDWHLRLRMHGQPEALLSGVLPVLNRAVEPLQESGEVWRVQLDTYEREVERYGGEQGIELAERIFAADSDAVLDIVRELRGDTGADLRWRAALLGIDLLFDDLGMTLDERRAVARTAREGYGPEFAVGSAFQREVGRRFRHERPVLERLFDRRLPVPAALTSSVAALHRRSAVVAALEPGIRSGAEGGTLTVTVPELALSLAHMHVNRLLRSAHRAQELVLYEMLERIYSSRAARGAG